MLVPLGEGGVGCHPRQWDVPCACRQGPRCPHRQREAADPEVTSRHRCLGFAKFRFSSSGNESVGSEPEETPLAVVMSPRNSAPPSPPTLLAHGAGGAPRCRAPLPTPHAPWALGLTWDSGLNPLLYCAQLVQAPPRCCSAPGALDTTSVPPTSLLWAPLLPLGPPTSRQRPSDPSGVLLPPAAPRDPRVALLSRPPTVPCPGRGHSPAPLPPAGAGLHSSVTVVNKYFGDSVVPAAGWVPSLALEPVAAVAPRGGPSAQLPTRLRSCSPPPPLPVPGSMAAGGAAEAGGGLCPCQRPRS